MIGAGAIVASDIPLNSVVVGNPAKVICTYESFIQKNIELMKSGKGYDTHYSQKSSEDIEKVQDDLMDGGIGFAYGLILQIAFKYIHRPSLPASSLSPF